MEPTMEGDDYYDYNNETVTVYGDLLDLVEECLSTYLPYSDIYLPSLYFLIFFAGVLGNLFVIVVICGKRKGGRLVDTFVVNLALADLVFVCTLPLWAVSASRGHRWDFGDALCKLSSYIIAVNRFSNIFFLTCMSVDRYLAVVRMLDSRFLRSSRCVRLTCGAVWVLSFALGTPSLVFRGAVSQGGNDTLCLEDSVDPIFQSLSLASLFLAFIIPVLVIVFCYGSILAQLRRPSGLANPRGEVRRRHSLKIVFTIIAAFVVSWLPFNIFKTILTGSRLRGVGLSCGEESLLARGLILSSCLAFFNSCANPAIYLFLDHHFRHRAYAVCLGCVGRRGPLRARVASTSFSFGTSDSFSGSATTRGRLFSITQKT
ncbi:probable G-protein coupled receptor 25 [Megalops cyprinoides]|uniref:probable G-protein coupled receptor 25 n=1 Tax=Megalops cyprinoides TaxID=118141 RepID=UPI001864EF3D|nr:probable G-protein coupled receptor 25 [Megalops cyprinoides]